jgi:hypothetical protein
MIYEHKITLSKAKHKYRSKQILLNRSIILYHKLFVLSAEGFAPDD